MWSAIIDFILKCIIRRSFWHVEKKNFVKIIQNMLFGHTCEHFLDPMSQYFPEILHDKFWWFACLPQVSLSFWQTDSLASLLVTVVRNEPRFKYLCALITSHYAMNIMPKKSWYAMTWSDPNIAIQHLTELDNW